MTNDVYKQSGISAKEAVALIGRLEVVPTILEAMAELTGMRFAAVARVTATTWTACAVRDRIEFGLAPGGELELGTTICDEIRQHGRAVIFGHASEHPHFSQHHTPKFYGLESYISLPIFLSDGTFFGTLCAIDSKPVDLSTLPVEKVLGLYTKLIAAQLESELRRDRAELALMDAEEAGRLRDQFVAVLGHDLRNPLQSITMGAQVLESALPDGREQRIAVHIQRSAQRMAELITNILDFARGRLGSGLNVLLESSHDLAGDLEHAISEIQRANPDTQIVVSTSLQHVFRCDRRRIAQLLSNLVSNAVTHGGTDRPVQVSLRSDESEFELTVVNAGEAIEQDKIGRLFEPFTRGTSAAPSPGLGLGLFIASEIAKAHAGKIEVVSSSEETRFVFRMPIWQGERSGPDKSLDVISAG
jgi:signal transduction histidine kinase